MRFETKRLYRDACNDSFFSKDGNDGCCAYGVTNKGWDLTDAKSIVLVFSTVPVKGASTCRVEHLQRAGLSALRRNFYGEHLIRPLKKSLNNEPKHEYFYHTNYNNERYYVIAYQDSQVDLSFVYTNKDQSIVLMPETKLWWWPEVVYYG